VGLKIEYAEGQTPLDEEERDGLLIDGITTRADLDEFEQQNIEKAVEWTMQRRYKAEKVFTQEFACELHRRMFGDVWKWAGQFRRSNKNLGCEWHKVGIALKQLNGDAAYWLQQQTCSAEELAVRYKHALASIHCFSNGNGRHSRLMGDIIVSHIFNQPVFTWGAAGLREKNDARVNYLKALKQADAGQLNRLVEFARSG
jgi:Fic-DOC domain mobile mystery protein B